MARGQHVRNAARQRQLELGADVALQSVTKFTGGRSDLLSGLVTVRDPTLLAALRRCRERSGSRSKLLG